MRADGRLQEGRGVSEAGLVRARGREKESLSTATVWVNTYCRCGGSLQSVLSSNTNNLNKETLELNLKFWSRVCSSAGVADAALQVAEQYFGILPKDAGLSDRCRRVIEQAGWDYIYLKIKILKRFFPLERGLNVALLKQICECGICTASGEFCRVTGGYVLEEKPTSRRFAETTLPMTGHDYTW